jgi:hypothetical protein
MVVMFRFQNVDGQIFRVAELAHMGGEGRDPQEEEGGDKRKEYTHSVPILDQVVRSAVSNRLDLCCVVEYRAMSAMGLAYVSKKRKVARMDLANRALCFAYRNPPPGVEKTPFKDIVKLVKKKDGSRPKIGAVAEAASSFKNVAGTIGRPPGSKKTTKPEDRKLMQTFKKLRPPGAGVDARAVHSALPKKIKGKISKRTVIRRLADKGFKPEKKINKSDPGPALALKRCAWCRKNSDKDARQWKAKLHAVGDIKEFTYYPEELQARLQKLRAPWTYMTKAEKKLPAFVRPKRWFPRKDWKKVKKQKVFGFTTSNGKKLAFFVPKPWSTEQWAVAVKKNVKPFLKKAFPKVKTFTLLLDGEKLLHGPAARAAFKDANIKIFPEWPKYSPDLNPQENVWAWAEQKLRKIEKSGEPFEVFRKKILKAVRAYPSAEKLVGSMAKRCRMVLDAQGAMLQK